MYWYEQDVRELEQACSRSGHDAEVLFYGSSTFRLWDSMATDLASVSVANLGFGGSTLAGCVWFFERLMAGFSPRALVVYAGDNDLGDGRHPEEVFIFFQQLMVKCKMRFGDIPCYFVSLKPSPVRWQMAEQFRYANNLIESEIIKIDRNWHFIDVFRPMLDKQGVPMAELYADDGLHLGPLGYRLWGEIIGRVLEGIRMDEKK